MAVIDIQGRKVTIDDAFLKASPEEQNATVEEIAASLPPATPEPQTGNLVGEYANQANEGVPVLGPLMNKARAGIDALTMGIPGVAAADDALGVDSKMSRAENIGQRYSENLEFQRKRTDKFAEENPITSTTARVGGAIAGIAPLVAAAPAAFGAVGTLPQMVARGALSGAGVSAADAVTRGTDPVHEGQVGALFGAAGGPVGKGIGKVASAFRAKPAPVPENVMPVSGVDVRVPTSDPAEAARIEIARRGAAGDPAQRVVTAADEADAAQFAKATENIGAQIDPTAPPGSPIATAPMAADQVTAELAAAERTRAAAEAAAQAQAATGTDSLRLGLAPQGALPVATTPFVAAETLGTRIQDAATKAREARKAAYDAKAAIPGEYGPTPIGKTAEAVAKALDSGADPVTLSETLTKHANEAMAVIRRRTAEAVQRAQRVVRDPETGRYVAVEKPEPITGRTVENIRKELNSLYAGAKAAARGPQANLTDKRAMDKIVDAFDEHLARVEGSGGFSGDAAALNAARDAARAAHRSYRQKFTPQGAGDVVGKNIEKIVGRYESQQALPDEIARMAYGHAGAPGGADATRMAERIKATFGEGSPEHGAYKQGMFSHLVDAADGSGPRPALDAAKRIEDYLREGSGHRMVAFSAAERSQLAAHAKTLRASAPAKIPTDSVEKAIARISGRDGGPPVTTTDAIEYLYSMTGKAVPVELAKRLEKELTPASWAALREGMFQKATDAPNRAALVKQLDTFLHGKGSPMANVMFQKGTPVRTELENLLEAHRKHLPIPGTTNPSGSAMLGAKIASRGSHAVLPVIFGTHGAIFGGGIPGALAGAGAGWAVDKAARGVVNARRAREAKRLIYGKQKAAPPSPTFGAIGGVLGQSLPAARR